MARNRTTFQPGHTQGFQPGNQLPVTHGANSAALVEKREAFISARIDDELAAVPYLGAPDGSLIRSYKHVVAQTELMREWFDRNGGLMTNRGSLKGAARQYLMLVRQQMEMAKVLGLGPVPRAQVARDMAGAGRDVAEVRAAQERLRLRQQLKVVGQGE